MSNGSGIIQVRQDNGDFFASPTLKKEQAVTVMSCMVLPWTQIHETTMIPEAHTVVNLIRGENPVFEQKEPTGCVLCKVRERCRDVKWNVFLPGLHQMVLHSA